MTTAQRQKFEDLPGEIPIFPLTGVLLLPRGQLPLNIFEPRYVAMVDHAIASHRLIGMVQTRDDGSVYNVGCAGRVTSYNETPDGRYEIVLTGICRFHFAEESSQLNGFRRVKARWTDYANDLQKMDSLDMDRGKLRRLLKNYFEKQGLTCSWDAVDQASDEKLMTTLAMICPLDAKEKQALLEAPCCRERARLFMTMLEMECTGGGGCKH
jgi:Lon protease-like protein